MLINRVGGGGENVTAEVNVQTPLVEDIAAILGAIAGRPAGTHLWAKFDSEGGDFIELAVSSEEDTYPNGAVANGYYYEKIFHVVCQDENGTYLLELAGAPQGGEDSGDVPGGDEPEVPVEPDVPVVYKKASEYAVGDSVYLNVNGVATEFIVVNQGVPGGDSQYVNADGTWLMTKYVYTTGKFDDRDYESNYTNGTLDNYLNTTFYGLLDGSVRSAIKTVTVPHLYNGNQSEKISRNVFALSINEVGQDYFLNVDNYKFNVDSGSALSYFSGASAADRIAYTAAGTATSWWLRDGYTDEYEMDGEVYTDYTGFVVHKSGGTILSDWVKNDCGYRPALILDSNTEFDASTNTIKM